MKKKERVKIKRKIRQVAEGIECYIVETINTYEFFSKGIRQAMPSYLKGDGLGIYVYFSEDRNHVLMLFDASEVKEKEFRFKIVKGNVFDALDFTKSFKSKKAAFVLHEVRNCVFKRVIVSNKKPFEVTGNSNKITLIDFEFDFPNGVSGKIDFGVIFSLELLREVFLETKKLIHQEIAVNQNEYSKNIEDQKKYHQDLIQRMDALFFNEKVEEKDIDAFLQENPVILEICLLIKPVVSQPLLSNSVKERFDQDMKPDLISQDFNGQWKIVDYKRAKYVLKRENSARQDVKADFYELKQQLKEYRGYFSEKEHRKWFDDTYGFSIPSYPKVIGIIGNVPKNRRDIFESATDDLPGWIRIVTYDELYNTFKHFVESQK